MNPSYKWLFYHYAAPFLERQAAFDDGWLTEALRSLPAPKKMRLGMFDAVLLFREQCCCEAFAHGVYLGVELARPEDFRKIAADFRSAVGSEPPVRPADLLQ